MKNKRMYKMYTIWTEDEGRANWVTEDYNVAKEAVDEWFNNFYSEFGYESVEEMKEKDKGLAYIVEINVKYWGDD